MGLIGLLLLPLSGLAQDITGTWYFKGFELEAESNPAGIELVEASYTVTITNLGGGNYRFAFTGADSGEFETTLTQSGNVYSSPIHTQPDGESSEEHIRNLLRVVNSTTLLFNRAEAGFTTSDAEFNPNFQWWAFSTMLVGTREPLTNSAAPALWSGNFSLGGTIHNEATNGSGFEGDFRSDGGLTITSVASGGGYRFTISSGEELFFTPSGQYLARDITPPNGPIWDNEFTRGTEVIRRDFGRFIQMPNGDVAVFFVDAIVGEVTGAVENSFTPYNFLDHFSTEVGYVTRQSEPVTITSSPASRSVEVGGSTSFTATVNQPAGTTPTFQWYRNDSAIAGETSLSLSLTNIQAADAGSYRLGVTSNGVAQFTTPAVLGVISAAKGGGGASQWVEDIQHPNGNYYDQVKLEDATGTLTADAGQVTRISFLDLNDDIVQVEFAGAGTLSISLAGSSGPAAPVKYNQPNVPYMKGHATITITGADETSNVTIFSVGRLTAYDPTGVYDITKPPSPTNNPANTGSPLFRSTEIYDGRADVALLNIISSNGKFGGIRAANASFWATSGNTGIYAPGVQFTGPVFVHDVNAQDAATSVLVTGAIDVGEIRITGGDLSQDNDRPVKIEGATRIQMAAGIDSHGTSLEAKSNQAVIERDSEVVTETVVANPE